MDSHYVIDRYCYYDHGGAVSRDHIMASIVPLFARDDIVRNDLPNDCERPFSRIYLFLLVVWPFILSAFGAALHVYWDFVAMCFNLIASAASQCSSMIIKEFSRSES